MIVRGNFVSLNTDKEDKLRESQLGNLAVGQYVTVAPHNVKRSGFSQLAVNVNEKPTNVFVNEDGIVKLTSPFTFSTLPDFNIRNLSNIRGKIFKVESVDLAERNRADGTVFTVPVYGLTAIPETEISETEGGA